MKISKKILLGGSLILFLSTLSLAYSSDLYNTKTDKEASSFKDNAKKFKNVAKTNESKRLIKEEKKNFRDIASDFKKNAKKGKLTPMDMNNNSASDTVLVRNSSDDMIAEVLGLGSPTQKNTNNRPPIVNNTYIEPHVNNVNTKSNYSEKAIVSEKKEESFSFQNALAKKSRGKLGQEKLHDDEIDRIFLSFIEERKIEKRRVAELKMLADEQKREDANTMRDKSPANAIGSLESQKAMLDAGLGGAVPSMAMVDGYGLNNTNLNGTPMGFTIHGTSCHFTECVAFTSEGVLRVGQTVESTGEIIKGITPTKFTTNLRKIKI